MGLFNWLKKNKKTSDESNETKDSRASSIRNVSHSNWQEEKNKKLDKLIEAQNSVGERKYIADGIIYDIESEEVNLNKLNVKIYEWLDKDGNHLDDYSIRDQFDIEKEISALDNYMPNYRVPKEKYKIFFINEFCFIEKNPRVWIQPFYGKFRLQDGTEVVVKTGQLLSKDEVKYATKIEQARKEFGIESIEELNSEQQQEFFQRIRDLHKSSTKFSFDIISKMKSSNGTNESGRNSELRSEKKILDASLDKVKNDANILLNVYPNLKGVDLVSVKQDFFQILDCSGFSFLSRPTDVGSPESMFCSDIDGSWYFAVNQMTMLFKAVSEDKLTDELNTILELNSINLQDRIEQNGYVAWKGSGFQIEHTLIEGCNVIIITNEDVAPENAAELKTTTLSKEVDFPVGYEYIGIEQLYDGEQFLKVNNGSLSLNVPLLFKDEDDGLNYILIGVSTPTIAKIIIDKIVERHSMEPAMDIAQDIWKYMHKTKFFFIGYLIPNNCIRINLIYNFISMRDGGEGVNLKAEKEDKKIAKKEFILKGVKQTHIVDDYNSYDYIDSESCEDLLSHFFNMEFESDDGETLFLVCHAYTRWENDCQQWVEYEFYNSSGLDSLDYKKLDYNLLNSNDSRELEEVIVEEMIPDDQTDVSTTIDGCIGGTYFI